MVQRPIKMSVRRPHFSLLTASGANGAHPRLTQFSGPGSPLVHRHKYAPGRILRPDWTALYPRSLMREKWFEVNQCLSCSVQRACQSLGSDIFVWVWLLSALQTTNID